MCSEGINTAQKKASEILYKRYGIVPAGSGVGASCDVVTSLSLHFYVSRPLSKEQAVRMLADCSQELVNQANASKLLRQFMENYPFTLKNVAISIQIQNEDGSEILAPGISYVASSNNGSIRYYVEKDGSSHMYNYQDTVQQVIDKYQHQNESGK